MVVERAGFSGNRGEQSWQAGARVKRWLVRCGWMALGIAGLYIGSALAGVVSGGPLDPPARRGRR